MSAFDSFHDDKPARADARRNHAHLLAVARRLFAEQGVANVPMAAIAEQAQVGKGTLYRHFADKAALCLALLDEDMRALQANTFQLLGQNLSASAKLLGFCELVYDYVDAHEDYLCSVAQQSDGRFLQDPAHLWWWQTVYGLLRQLPMAEDRARALATAIYVLLDVQTLRFQRAQFGHDRQAIMAQIRALVGE
ncbi:MAG: TetR/AcrR family transcriptional regulator [Anaerolineae bacterium]|nr:TetR/AcrR family transcriptional regulator [Anaerolineae bacterium]MDW8171671.1 helix-turn-helix domain-containing protein [Anaerolineae bacterium]